MSISNMDDFHRKITSPKSNTTIIPTLNLEFVLSPESVGTDQSLLIIGNKQNAFIVNILINFVPIQFDDPPKNLRSSILSSLIKISSIARCDHKNH